MVKYESTNKGAHYIVIGTERFRSIQSKIKILQDISLHSHDWIQFLQLLRERKLPLLEIAEIIFGEKRAENLEKVIWTLLELALEENTLMIQDYFEYHAHKCFKLFWIHRYAYFEYHGFKMEKGNFLRTRFDRGMDTLQKDMRFQIENALSTGRNDNSIQLRILPTTRYEAKINYMNTGWKNITLDFHFSFHMHKDAIKSIEMIKSIEVALVENKSLIDIATKFKVGAAIVMTYALSACRDKFLKSMKRSFRIQLHSNVHVSLSQVLQANIEQENNFLTKLKNIDDESYQIIVRLADKYQNLQVRLYNILNKIVLSKKSKKYNLGYIKNGKWRSFAIELDTIAYDTITPDLKSYALHLAAKGNDGKTIRNSIAFFKSVKATSRRFNISANGITETDLSKCFNMHSKKNTTRNIKNSISSFYKFLISSKTVNGETGTLVLSKIQKMISNEFSVKGSIVNNPTIPLPEEVYLQIRSYSSELSIAIKNAFLIISATGCRPSELAYIESTSLTFNTKMDCHVLKIYMNKQEKAYAKKGKMPYRNVPVYDEDAIQAFNHQVSISKEERHESGNKAIFIRRNVNVVHQVKYHTPSSKELLKEVNLLIERHNIKADFEDEKWHYTPYQMRSMLATAMVEKGHAPEEIKAFFGWLTVHTPEKAYAYIRKQKEEELNTEFFKKHFRAQFNEKNLKAYSREDKEQLFTEMYVHKRKMEYGECVRHPIMGECGKLQAPESCASCARLITDTPYLKTWIKLRDNQNEILQSMINSFAAEGISKDDYTQWAEYIIQEHRLQSYQSLVEKLEIEKERYVSLG